MMEQEKKTYTFDNKSKKDIGTIRIADDVVATIAAYAAMEVEGVASLAGGITKSQLSHGTKKLGKSVRVEVTKNGVRAELAIVMDYGFNIPVTSGRIQRKVQAEIENMTGLTVLDVNIRIAGIAMTTEA